MAVRNCRWETLDGRGVVCKHILNDGDHKSLSLHMVSLSKILGPLRAVESLLGVCKGCRGVFQMSSMFGAHPIF